MIPGSGGLTLILILVVILAAVPGVNKWMDGQIDQTIREIDKSAWQIEKIYLWWSSADSQPGINTIFPEIHHSPEEFHTGSDLSSVKGIFNFDNREPFGIDWIDYQVSDQVNRILALVKSGDDKNSDAVISRVAGLQDLLTRKIASLEKHKTALARERQLADIILLSLMAVTSLAGYFISRNRLTNPAHLLLEQVEMISEGDIVNRKLLNRNDIFGKVSFKIENVRQHISDVAHFIQRIGENDFNTSDLNIGQTNLLGTSLIQMQKKLKMVAEEDKRRNWVNEGLTRFSEILRKHNDDLAILSEDMIINLTKYLNVNQSSLFLLKEEDGRPLLETMATYAWDRKKYVTGKFGLKENLLGQAILEKDIIYLSDVPDSFVHITSGLGKANPREILIVPMIINDEPQGVIELASFAKFEPHMIEFVKHVSENIASTIIGIKTNNQTRRLLRESQEMTNQLKLQEEELRQNTKDLSAAKENLNLQLEEAKMEMQMQIQKIEAERKKNIAILEGCEDGVITFKTNGIIDFFNKAAEDIWQIPREKALGKHIRAFIPVEITDSVDTAKVIYVGEGNSKTIDSRTELSIFDANGQEISVLTTLSVGKLEEESTFAFFIQRISVELF